MIKKQIIILLIITLSLAACNVGSTPAPTVDVNAINTAAFSTAVAQISAQQTMTALAAPSNTPLPTNTAASTVGGVPTLAGASPTGNAGALPTISFNTTPNANTTPLAGLTPAGSTPLAPAAPAGPASSGGTVCNSLTYVADLTYPDGSVFDGGEDFTKTWQVKNSGTCKWDEGYKLVYMEGDDELDPVDLPLKSGHYVDPGQTAELSVELTAPLARGTFKGTWQMQSDNGEFFGDSLTVSIEVK
jgi:hypothetical protein